MRFHLLLARTYGLPTRAALYEFLPDPRDLAEHEEEFQLYRWGPELDKYCAAQIVDAAVAMQGGRSLPLEERILRFDRDASAEKAGRKQQSRQAIEQGAASGSGWIRLSPPQPRKS